MQQRPVGRNPISPAVSADAWVSGAACGERDFLMDPSINMAYWAATRRRSAAGERRQLDNQPEVYPVKRTVLGIFAFATLAFALPAAAEDVSGWQDAKWGMTPDEVQKVLSYPASVADLAKVCGENCKEGAALELDDYELNGQHFLVRFWFSKPEARLRTVSMYAKQLDKENDNAGFAKMKDYLGSLYGSPQSTELKHGYFNVTWLLSSTKIMLYSNATTETTVVYEERTKKASG
jgi:hypothetical protein